MGWVGYARLVRVQVLALRQRDHVLAATALGRTAPVIMRRHLLPLVMAPVWVEASFGLAGAVVAEAGLSFLGLGVQPPEASWGGMIRDGVRYLLVAPHLVLAPGIALFLVVLAANLFGDRCVIASMSLYIIGREIQVLDDRVWPVNDSNCSLPRPTPPCAGTLCHHGSSRCFPSWPANSIRIHGVMRRHAVRRAAARRLLGHQLDVTADILRSAAEVADKRGLQREIGDIDLRRFVRGESR